MSSPYAPARRYLWTGLASITLLIALLSLLMSVSAQTEPLPPVAVEGAEVVGISEAHITTPLTTISPAAPYTGPMIERARSGSENAVLGLQGISDVPLVEAADPLAAQQIAAPERQERVFSSKLLNIDGQSFTGIHPSDNVGDVGLTEYVQLVNHPDGSQMTVYNKTTGAKIGGPIILGSLAPATSPCRLSANGAPIVVFDSYAKRWLMVEISDNPNTLCVYLSQTSSAMGTYYAYQWAIPGYPGYPKVSVWHDAFYVTANEDPGGTGVNFPSIYALERNDMLVGGAASLLRVTLPALPGFEFQALTPADADGINPPPPSQPAMFMRHVDDELHDPSPTPGQDRLELWMYRPNFANPGTSVLMGPTHLPIADFDSDFCSNSFSCIPQPGSSTLLDPLLEPIMWRLQYRNFNTHQSLVGSFTVGDLDPGSNDRAAVRWFEVRGGSLTWNLYQQGTFTAADTTHRWMSTIAMDRFGNMALGFNASNNTLISPSIYYTGRRASDGIGTMTQGSILVQAGNSSLSNSRWGDYNSLNVDPIDDCTFYFTANYTKGGVWATRISSFRFDDVCTGAPAPTLTPSVAPPTHTPTATIAPVAIQLIQNGGFEAKDGAGAPSLTAWSVANPTKEKIKCNNPAKGKVIARSGQCAFMFKGVPGEAAKLKQTYNGTETFFIEGDVIGFSFHVNAPKPVVDLKAKIKVKYEDASIPTGKNTITLQPTGGVYQAKGTSYTLVNDFVSKIKLIFDHRTPTGKLYIDDVSLIWNQVAARRVQRQRPADISADAPIEAPIGLP